MAVDADLVADCKAKAARKEVAVEVRLGGSGRPSLGPGYEDYGAMAELERTVSLYPEGMGITGGSRRGRCGCGGTPGARRIPARRDTGNWT
jgi:hypothetical protein